MNQYKVIAETKIKVHCGCPAEFNIYAKNNKEAIKEARRQVWLEGLWDRTDGPIEYTAELID